MKHHFAAKMVFEDYYKKKTSKTIDENFDFQNNTSSFVVCMKNNFEKQK